LSRPARPSAPALPSSFWSNTRHTSIMAEHVADFEWRGEGAEAEVVLYAPNPTVAESSFERALPAARLPGMTGPVYAAASLRGFGWVAASETHAAPDLVSAPGCGLLLVADTPVEDVAGTPEEVPRLISRRLSEVALPGVRSDAEVREISESGALWAAGEGLIEEEDLPFLTPSTGDADTIDRRSLAAGARDWTRPGIIRAFRVAEILDPERAGGMGLESGALALVVSAGAEDLGRLALAGHRERILARTTRGEFGAPDDLPAAPVATGEARDLLTATGAAANYAAGRAALVLYALRRALGDHVGALGPRAGWTLGGFEERDGAVLHREGLAVAGEGEALVSGGSVAAGTGGMLGSAPPFGAAEERGRWPWEEAGILAQWTVLELL
jgi:tRNA-splicing ligase RtcB